MTVKSRKLSINSARGFSLMEVLVSVMVVSIGLLGVAGLQITGLRQQQGANFHTSALYLANDIADRLRANRAGVQHGFYNAIDIDSTQDAPLIDTDCTTGRCNTGQIADLDISQWRALLKPALPSGTLSVKKIADRFDITVGWREQSGLHHITLNVEP